MQGKICGYRITPKFFEDGQLADRADTYVLIEELGRGNDGGYIEFKVTHEGLFIDVVSLSGDVIGTRCETFDDIVFECIGEFE